MAAKGSMSFDEATLACFREAEASLGEGGAAFATDVVEVAVAAGWTRVGDPGRAGVNSFAAILLGSPRVGGCPATCCAGERFSSPSWGVRKQRHGPPASRCCCAGRSRAGDDTEPADTPAE